MSKVKNYIFSICEHFFEIVTVFVTFKYIIYILGLQNLGIWSMANAITSLASVGTSGFASSAIKFVASSFSDNNLTKTRYVVTTSCILVFLTSILMTLTIYLGFRIWGGFFLIDQEFDNISKLIGYVLVLFNVSILARLFQSCLDGMLEIQTRVKINIVSKILYLVSFYFMVNTKGLIGVSISMIFQQLFIIFLSLGFIIRRLNFSFRMKFWDRDTFIEIFRYGYVFQLNSLLQMFSDPFTRFMIKNYGSLEILGVFEVVYKVFTQVRMLVIVILNTYLPYLVTSQSKSLELKKKEFTKFWDITIYISTLMLTSIFPSLIVVIKVLGLELNNGIYQIALLLYVALLSNLYSSTLYYDNLASGKIKHNFYGLVVFTITNIFTAFIFGNLWGFFGVLISWSLSHILGSLILFYFYSMDCHFDISKIYSKGQKLFSVLCICTVVFVCIFNNILTPWLTSIFSIIILTIIALKFMPLDYLKKDGLI